MTSIPASRSARAITLAPRSWPSRPGLAISTRIFRSAICGLPEFRKDHDVVVRAVAVEVTCQLPLLHETLSEEDVLGTLVVVEDVDAQLDQVHLVEGETDQGLDGVAAEAAVPRRRLADEEAEPAGARDPVDVVDRGVADVRAVVLSLDGEVPLVRPRIHGPIEPLHLALEGDR